MMMLTNEQFGGRVGCSESMASRLRGGKRLPSAGLLLEIRRAFDLDLDDTLAAYESGQVAFGAFLREQVFSPESIAA